MFSIYFDDKPINAQIGKEVISVTIPYSCDCAYLEIIYNIEVSDEYVLFPACAYNGNKFDVLKKKYPPMFEVAEGKVDMPVTITDVVHLNKDGSGKIEVTTGDVSVPMVGVYSNKRGTLLFTVQEINGTNLGLSYENGKISITYPHLRKEKMYRWGKADCLIPSVDKGISFEKGQVIEIPYKLINFNCESISEFYKMFFENRKCMQLDDQRPYVIPFERQLQIQIDKYNNMNYRDNPGFYGSGVGGYEGTVWQPGWCGDGMISYVLMKYGGELEWERGIKTLEFLFDNQAKSGFFFSVIFGDGRIGGDGFDIEGTENWHLVRKSEDILYFLYKHFLLMQDRNYEIPAKFIDGARKIADAFVRLWEKYEQFGQFVDLETGEIAVGGSTSGAIVPAGLVSSYKFFNDEKYLDVAKRAAQMFYNRDVSKGYTTGGPGEILQCPDSESAFAMLESFVELYAMTKEEKWLKYAQEMSWICSSWVVCYNYKFPENSEFKRLDMKTIGTVFANVQNKHSAPGICTLSGNSLYKLYEFTGNEQYLELIKDIALAISQYMSTEEKPIYSWDEIPQKLPQGFINERVNMSDWEDYDKIGGVFYGSCWCEASNLLTIAETIPCLYGSVYTNG
jgi:hypothetical protein